MGLTIVPGNMIEDGTVVSADLAVDPRNASNLNSGSVPAAQLGNVPSLNPLKDDVALLGFKAAANGSLAKYDLLDQTVDAFEDASGVDPLASTNEVRDSSGNYYYSTVYGSYSTDSITSTGAGTWTAPASTYQAEIQAEYDAAAYARTRANAYPSIGDQLDMLWHAIDTGDWTAAKVKTTEFYTALKAVKDANPKP